MLITPELSAAELKTFDKDQNSGRLPHALWASDTRNSHEISLNNILQLELYGPDGTPAGRPPTAPPERVHAALSKGSMRYPVDGHLDDKVEALWWAVERGEAGALQELQSAAKRKSPLQADLAKVLDAVKAGTAKRQDELLAAPPTIDTYEQLESFITASQGLDTKPAVARLKELKAMKELRDELKAREAYQQIATMLQSNKPDQQKAGKAALQELGQRLPNTKYGAIAAGSK